MKRGETKNILFVKLLAVIFISIFILETVDADVVRHIGSWPYTRYNGGCVTEFSDCHKGLWQEKCFRIGKSNWGWCKRIACTEISGDIDACKTNERCKPLYVGEPSKGFWAGRCEKCLPAGTKLSHLLYWDPTGWDSSKCCGIHFDESTHKCCAGENENCKNDGDCCQDGIDQICGSAGKCISFTCLTAGEKIGKRDYCCGGLGYDHVTRTCCIKTGEPDSGDADKCCTGISYNNLCTEEAGCNSVDGGWDTAWGACSKSCGGGVQTLACNNPKPFCGGKSCSGGNANVYEYIHPDYGPTLKIIILAKKQKSCNTQPCGTVTTAYCGDGICTSREHLFWMKYGTCEEDCGE